MKLNWSLVTWGVGILMVVGITYGDAKSRIINLEKNQLKLEERYQTIIDKQDELISRLISIEVKLEERTNGKGTK